ncbi:hypothetical protein OK348_02835 [Flavobacterium sp. MXW15]|nr:hypothetical protein [Flavobacterium sp. MXW15]
MRGVAVGAFGASLLILVTGMALHAVSRMPRREVEGKISPREWQAWIGLCVNAAGAVCFATRLPLLAEGAGPAARDVAVSLIGLLLAWLVLSRLLAARWKGRVQVDERDRQVEIPAAGWSRGAVVAGLVGLALTFGFSPPGRLQWASHFLIGNLLVFVLACGWLAEHAGMVWMYWRDRSRSQQV